MKYRWLCAALLMTATPMTTLIPMAHARVVERIVALVGSEIVLQSEVDERTAPYLADISALPTAAQRNTRTAALRKEVLERIIDEVLLVQQATDLKLAVTSEEVDRAVDHIKRENKLTDQLLADELRKAGMTLTQYRQNWRKEIVKSKVLNITVGSKVSITDADLQSYYERHMKTGANAEIRVSHIFIAIPDDADAATVLEKEKQAKALGERAKKGEDFAKLAKEFSEDRATRAEGGDMGFFGKDMGLPKPIEELVFTMDKGQIGGPVRGNRGFSVLKVVERRAKDVKPFAEIRENLRLQLYQKEFERQSKTYLTELRKKTLVDIRL